MVAVPGQEARKHHFVPEFLLKPWATEGVLRGYWWDARKGAVSCKRKGTRSFCFQIDLLTLRGQSLGRDALERLPFGEIDTKGARVRDGLLTLGPRGLNGEERCDFARLLLSLDGRRPETVAKFRANAGDLVETLDSDPEILAAMEDEGLTETPTSYYERTVGVLLEDRALLSIQSFVDNPEVGGRLINARWHVVHLGPSDGSLVLSDRPLIRIKAYNHPSAMWVLPLAPKVGFVAVNHPAKLDQIRRVPLRRFAKECNALSADQAERFIFCSDTSHEHWIGKYLCRARSSDRGIG